MQGWEIDRNSRGRQGVIGRNVGASGDQHQKHRINISEVSIEPVCNNGVRPVWSGDIYPRMGVGNAENVQICTSATCDEEDVESTGLEYISLQN